MNNPGLFFCIVLVPVLGKLQDDIKCDPFAYLSINRTLITARRPPLISRVSFDSTLDELITVTRRWTPFCYARENQPEKKQRDTPSKILEKKPLIKLDQSFLDDLIVRAGGPTHGQDHVRIKRSTIGNFTVSTYLRSQDSPYEVITNLTVPEGVTVNVEKGVEFLFRPNLGINVRGRLVARGTRDDPIIMKSLVDKENWKGIVFETVFKAYDLRLTGGQTRNDGYLEIHDGRIWRLVCFRGWTRADADVACKQLGFGQGAFAELPPMAFPPLSKSYWLSNVDCTGSEKSLKDCKSQQTTACQRPATVRCSGEPFTDNTTRKIETSILEYINCSHAENGITVKASSSATVPILNFVTAQNSLNNGITIETFYVPEPNQAPRLYKCLLINNHISGLALRLWYPPKDLATIFTIEESLASVGEADGIKIEGRGNIQIIRSAVFSNARNGIDVRLEAGSVKLDELVIGANSLTGLSISKSNSSTAIVTDRLSASLSNSKITSHWTGAAAVFEDCDLTVEGNEFWDNYNGCVSLPRPTKKCEIKVLENNFTRNRGSIIRSVISDAKLRLEKNLFKLNILSDYNDPRQAVIRIDLDDNVNGSNAVQIISNRFTKNTMHNCVSIQPSNGDKRASCTLLIQDNSLTDNLITNTIFVDVSEANISRNIFSNPVSECELKTGVSSNNGEPINAKNNFWGLSDEQLIRRKICDGSTNKFQTMIDIKPWALSAPNGPGVQGGSRGPPESISWVPAPQPTVLNFQGAKDNQLKTKPYENLIAPNVGKSNGKSTATRPFVSDDQVSENYEISGTGKPYSVAQNLVVSAKSTLTIARGAVLEFDNDRELRVEGTIIAKGTEDEPIIFRAALGKTWNGITFENKNSPTSVLENCIIDGARIGLLINSDKLAIHRCIISNSINGITLTDNAGDTVDLGDTTVLNAQDVGLRVANRLQSIDIRNFYIDNTGGNGIDVDHPLINVSLSNCRLSNSRRYAMHVDQMMFSKQTLAIKNCTVVNQNGIGGIYLVARDYGLIRIINTVFSNNNAKSLIVDLKCNFTGEMAVGRASRFELIDNRFENDNDNVVDIHLAYCSHANISRNAFVSNNRDHRYGVFNLQLDPLKSPTSKENFKIHFLNNSFTQNAGDYSAYMLSMSMADFVGVLSGNRFLDNENRRSVLILGSPPFQVNYNEFDNRRSTYNLETEYNDAKITDATNNFWGTVRENEIHDSIFDGTIIPYRGVVKFTPFLQSAPTNNSSTNSSAISTCDRKANCRGNGDCVGDQICACFPGYVGDQCERFSCRDLADCNGNGRCVGPNQCQCFEGWSGSDCRSATCLGLNNCSSHGECVSLNECQCETGWTGIDCNIQDIFGNSTGHLVRSSTATGGRQTGTAASTPTTANVATGTGSPQNQCPNQCNQHGRCVNGTRCECETGWLGSSCALPDCNGEITKNCSGRGVCVGPNRCTCDGHHSGLDCGICIANSSIDGGGCDIGNSTVPPIRTVRSVATFSPRITTPSPRVSTDPPVECRQKCEHGFCDLRFGQCQCYSPWTGPNCNQCTRAVCTPTEFGILSLSPESAPASMTSSSAAEYIVRVVGVNFTKPSTSHYACRYGDVATAGLWLTNTELDCPVPPLQRVGSTNFSVLPLSANDSDLITISADRRRPWITAPVLFTFYAICGNVTCGENSFCFRGSCYCSVGTENGRCEETLEMKPVIDTASLTSALTNVHELQPIFVQLKSKNPNLLIRWELVEGPTGAAVDPSTGELSWPQPLGSSEPIKFTIFTHASTGVDSNSIAVTVATTYQPIIDKFTNNANGTVMVEGHIDLSPDFIGTPTVPVAIVIYKNGQLLEEWQAVTDKDGSFSSIYGSPIGEGGQYTIVAVHPGNLTAKYDGNQTTTSFTWVVQTIRVWPKTQLVLYDQKDRANVVVAVENLGTSPMHISRIMVQPTSPIIINISQVTIVNGVSTTLAPTYALETGTNTTLNIELVIFATIPTDRYFSFAISTQESAKDDFSIRLKRSSPGPWLSADPSNLRFALVFEEPWPITTIKISNDGRATARNLIRQLNADSFVQVVDLYKNGLSIVNSSRFDLAPGETVILSICIAPPSSFPGSGAIDLSGRVYTGNITIAFVPGEPTLVPLVIPYVVEFRSSSMIDRFTVLLLTDQPANGARQANPNPATVPGALVGLSNSFLERNKTTVTDVNGMAQFTNVPSGFYSLSIDKPGFNPIRRVIKVVLDQPPSVTVMLENYFSGESQLSGAGVQLIRNAAGNGYQLQWPTTGSSQNTLLPFLELEPRAMILAFDNVIKSEKLLVARNFGGTTAMGLSINTNDSRLPLIMQNEATDIPPGEYRALHLSITPQSNFNAPLDQQCDAYILYFYYTYQTAAANGTKRFPFLVNGKSDYDTENIRVCEFDPILGTLVTRAIDLSLSVSCDCRSSVIHQCLSSYNEPLSVCGSAFSSISNASTDLGILFQTFFGLAVCSMTKINLEKGKETVECLANMQNACAGTQKIWQSRSRRDAVEQRETSRFFDQIQFANGVSTKLGNPFGQIFPFLLRDSIQSQTAESMLLFNHWFDLLSSILGTPTLYISTEPWFSEFTNSISDGSESGEIISKAELGTILSTLTPGYARQKPAVLFLLERWNGTVVQGQRILTSSQDEIFESQNFVSYAALQDFYSQTSVLNAFAASQGYPNNFFRVLDRDIYNLRITLSESGSSSDCLLTNIKIEPAEVDEGDRLTLQLTLKNLLNSTALQINELTPQFRSLNTEDFFITFVRAESKYPGAVMERNGGQYFAYWNVEMELRRRLTKPNFYKVDLLIVFSQLGLRTQTQTKIQSVPFTVRPKASLRVLYFLYVPVLSADSQISKSDRKPNIVIALMNNGYRDLINLTVNGAEVKVVENAQRTRPVPFRLDYVSVDGQQWPNYFDVNVPLLRSGQVKYIQYGLSSSATGKIQLDDFRATVLANGEILRLASQETFWIVQWLDEISKNALSNASDIVSSNLLLGVKTQQGVQPTSLYTGKTTLVAPVNEAELVGSSEGWETINEKPYLFHIRLQYRQNIQSNRPGALYGEYTLPVTLNDTYDLLSGSRTNISLDPSHTWLSQGGGRGDDNARTGRRILNFVDPSMPIDQELVTYEFVFGEKNKEPPKFDQQSITLSIPSPINVGTVIGSVKAIDPEGGNVIYGLYGGDGYFVISPKTGEIKIAKLPLPNNESRICLVASATDDGFPKKAAYQNVDVPLKESGSCSILPNIDLLPNNLEIPFGEVTTQSRFPTGLSSQSVQTIFGQSGSSTNLGSTVSTISGSTILAANMSTTSLSMQGEVSLSTITGEWMTPATRITGASTQTVGTLGNISETSSTGTPINFVTGTGSSYSTASEIGSSIFGLSSNYPTISGSSYQNISGSTYPTGTGSSYPTIFGSTYSTGTGTGSSSSTIFASSSYFPTLGSGSSTTISSFSTGSNTPNMASFSSPSSSTTSNVPTFSTVLASSTPNPSTLGPSTSPALSFSSPIWSTFSGTTASSSGNVGATNFSVSSSISFVSLITAQSLASVSVAEDGDDTFPTAPGPTTVSPVQNSALPALQNTPGFLPPEIIRGLGTEVNVSSLSTDDLVMLACKLRGSKPIWGIICDLGKAAATQTTSTPSPAAKKLLDQIR